MKNDTDFLEETKPVLIKLFFKTVLLLLIGVLIFTTGLCVILSIGLMVTKMFLVGFLLFLVGIPVMVVMIKFLYMVLNKIEGE